MNLTRERLFVDPVSRSDPPAVIMRPLEGVNVSEGQAANVSCQYNANPPNISEVTWYKDGHVLAVDRRRHDRPLLRHQVALFRIHNVSRDDQGAYSCHVRNAFGTGNSSNAIQLDVFCEYKRHLSTLHYPISLQYSITVACRCYGLQGFVLGICVQ